MNNQEDIITCAWNVYLMFCGGDKYLAWAGIIVIGLAALQAGTSEPDSQSGNDPCGLD